MSPKFRERTSGGFEWSSMGLTPAEGASSNQAIFTFIAGE